MRNRLALQALLAVGSFFRSLPALLSNTSASSSAVAGVGDLYAHPSPRRAARPRWIEQGPGRGKRLLYLPAGDYPDLARPRNKTNEAARRVRQRERDEANRARRAPRLFDATGR